jgi:hypothetical protein
MHQSEAPADDSRRAEYALYARRGRIRDDIEILGLAAEEEIADGTAHDVGFMPVLAQSIHDAQSIRIYPGTFYLMFRLCVNDGLSYGFPVLGSSVTDEQYGASPMIWMKIQLLYNRKPGAAKAAVVIELCPAWTRAMP